MSTPPGVETRGPAIVGVAIAFPILAAVFVGLRVYTRVRIINFFGIDDWCAIFTLCISIVYSVLLGIWTQHGGGMHTADVTPEIEEQYYFWLLIASEFYATALLGYKTAILLLYVRIFGANKKFKIACYIVMAFNAGYLISNIILQIFSCTPVQKYYESYTDKNMPGHCISLVPPDIAWGAMSMLSDFAIAILPIPVIWRLKLSKRDKILLSLVFLSGLIAFAMATVRWIIATIDLTAEDRIWIAGLTFLFSIVEVNTGIICGCTATLKPLFRFAREQTSRRRSSARYSYEKRHIFRKRHHGRSSNSDEEQQTRADHPPAPRAPPGTMNQMSAIDEKIVDRDESPESKASTASPISRATTARPSLVEARPATLEWSQDLLNLPREGTDEQPRLASARDIHEVDAVEQAKEKEKSEWPLNNAV